MIHIRCGPVVPMIEYEAPLAEYPVAVFADFEAH